MRTHKWNDIAAEFSSPAQRQASKAAAEAFSLRLAAVRKAQELTQVEMAQKLGISQPSVAAIEGRTDLQLSTLAKYVTAMGGTLKLFAEFPEATINLLAGADVNGPEDQAAVI